MAEKLIPLSHFDQLPDHTVGHDVLRYVSMSQVFGEEKDSILYFIGRNLARRIAIETLDDLYYLFNKFRWGNLELIKDRRKTLTFHLMSDDVAERILSPFSVDFRLESGFLAEAIEKITRRPCECTETVNERLYRVQFKITFTDN